MLDPPHGEDIDAQMIVDLRRMLSARGDDRRREKLRCTMKGVKTRIRG